MATECYTVRLTRPEGVSVTEMRNYIREAVQTYGGQFRPPGAHGQDDDGDPLFGGVKCIVKRNREK